MNDPYVGELMELESVKRGLYSAREGVADPEAARFTPIATMHTHTHTIPPTTPTQTNHIAQQRSPKTSVPLFVLNFTHRHCW